MRTRIIVGAALVIGLLGVGIYASRADEITGRTQWSLVNFIDPVLVKDQLVMGPVLIVHDSDKMARGEPCTTFYRFEPGKGPKEELVSFHCRPVQRAFVEQTTLNVVPTVSGCKRLTEFQIGGDTEGHGIPLK
jgi:hypothetical protein